MPEEPYTKVTLGDVFRKLESLERRVIEREHRYVTREGFAKGILGSIVAAVGLAWTIIQIGDRLWS